MKDSSFGMQIATAGQFLKYYEPKRYTLIDRIGVPFRQNIVVSLDPEKFADVSFWQAGMDWSEYKKFARAAILRIGQGSWADTEFQINYKNAREQGILLGGYWFYDGRNSPAEQAALVVSLMKNKYFDLELYVDWEKNYKGAYEGLKNVVAFMKLLDSAGLRVKNIGMYTGYYWYLDNAGTDHSYDDYLKAKPLWLAWYAAPSVVKIPAPWTAWNLWQSSTPAVKWGQPTAEIDMNVYNGTKTEFTIRYGLGVQMVKGTVHAVPSMNIREKADLTSTDMGDLFTGDIIYGDLVGSWIRIQQIWRKSGQVENNSYYAWAGNAEWLTWEVVSAIPTPPPTPASESYEVILNRLDINGNVVETWRGVVSK